jgi:Outer membrane protein beta-barrel domain
MTNIKKSLLAIGLLTASLLPSQHITYIICEDCYSGLEVGVNQSNVTGFPQGSPKIGFYAGFFRFKPMNEKFTLGIGATYNNIGAKVSGYDTPLIIHSINSPVGIYYRINDMFQCFAGGELGVNMFGKLPQNEKTAAVSDTYFGKDFDMMHTFKAFDGGVFAGAGYILANNIDINLRYSLGLTSVNKNDHLEKNPWKKNFLTLSIGYTFRPAQD